MDGWMDGWMDMGMDGFIDGWGSRPLLSTHMPIG